MTGADPAVPLLVANWKMNLDRDGAVALARTVAADACCNGPTRVLLAPPYPFLQLVGETIDSTPVGLAAQDIHWEASGAFTGAVSAGMVAGMGATHVIVGHSERRQHFGDNDDSVRRKTGAALGAGLVPIVCIGESWEQRRAGRALEVVTAQVEAALAAPSPPRSPETVVAYEPVWAIGTGKVASVSQVAEIHGVIRGLVGAGVSILYGGSVNEDNAGDLLAVADVDGALVGGASLSATSFGGILRAAAGRPS